MTNLLRETIAIAAIMRAVSAAGAQSEEKSVNTAVAISVVSTAVPVVIAVFGGTGQRATNPRIFGVVGMWFGPAMGYWYADAPGWRKGMSLRTGVLSLALMMSMATSTACAVQNTDGQPHHGDCGWRTGTQIAAAAVMLGSGIYDITMLPGAMRSGREETRRISVMPTLALDGRSSGVAVRVSF
jgi:hypothetical protein